MMNKLNIAALIAGVILTLASIMWSLILELNGLPALDQVVITVVFGLITFTLAARSSQ